MGAGWAKVQCVVGCMMDALDARLTNAGWEEENPGSGTEEPDE